MNWWRSLPDEESAGGLSNTSSKVKSDTTVYSKVTKQNSFLEENLVNFRCEV